MHFLQASVPIGTGNHIKSVMRILLCSLCAVLTTAASSHRFIPRKTFNNCSTILEVDFGPRQDHNILKFCKTIGSFSLLTSSITFVFILLMVDLWTPSLTAICSINCWFTKEANVIRLWWLRTKTSSGTKKKNPHKCWNKNSIASHFLFKFKSKIHFN